MSHPEVGAMVAGAYRLTGELARGGMGSVWHATNVNLDAPVAVKFMHVDLVDDDELRARFEREAKASARIRSPHVVHIHDHGVDPATGMPFIVMEALEGEDLASRLKREGKLEAAEAIRICNQICRGLRRAHDLGIVHRDLKPANVFLCERDDDMVKILDFGIAKLASRAGQTLGERAGDALTATGQILGSPHYMSPEQVRGTDVDARSDLWSLAVILYRLLTGRRPFPAREMSAVFVQICVDPIPPPSELEPSLPASVDRFFAKALNRDRDGRFSTAKYFADAFAEALAPQSPTLPSIRPAPVHVEAEHVLPTAPPATGRAGATLVDETSEPASRSVLRYLSSLVVAALLLVGVLSLLHPETIDAAKQVVLDLIARIQEMANEPDYQ